MGAISEMARESADGRLGGRTGEGTGGDMMDSGGDGRC